MGLDISVYRKVDLVDAISFEEMKRRNWDHPLYESDEHAFLCNVHEEYRPRFPAEGIYRVTPADGFDGYKGSGFRAGSYSGYNRWREHLASLVDTTPSEVWDGNRPIGFNDLIAFSDCEGTIGGDAARQLAADFATFQADAEKYAARLGGEEGAWFLDRYCQWRRAFEQAADAGAVKFH